MPERVDELLSVDTASAYLKAEGVAPADARVRTDELAGGISNVVLLARWDGGEVVIKQSLPELRVAAQWNFDRRRTLIEHECLEFLAEVLPGTAPTPVFCDHERFVLGMTPAAAGGTVWKEAHMRGEIVPERATAAARLLARLQCRTHDDPRAARAFDDLMPLLEGRIDPYHRAAAALHPDLAPLITREIDRMLGCRSVLVHGDYSPKNLIAYPDRMLMLDLEVAHWGDPAFDPAFLLTHLILGSCYRGVRADDLLSQAFAFWRVYRTEAGAAAAPDHDVVAELGCLLLARIDGKSPIEYLPDEHVRERVRSLARVALLGSAELGVEDLLAEAWRVLHGVGDGVDRSGAGANQGDL